MSTKTLTIEGNLGKDPVIKVTNAGKKVCNFSIAENKEFTDENGNKQKKAVWHAIECWDKNAEECESHLSKGSKVSVTGIVKLSNWTDKEGQERFSKTIVANEINIISKKSSNNDSTHSL